MDTYLPAVDSRDLSATMETFGFTILKCLADGRHPELKFHPLVYKFLLYGRNVEASLKDLATFDLVMERNLRQLIVNPGAEYLCLEFETELFMELDTSTRNRLEQLKIRPHDEVTDANKVEYVRLTIRNHLIGKRLQHLLALRKGFLYNDVLSAHLKMFSDYDLQLLLLGNTNLRAADLKAVLDFDSGLGALIPQWTYEVLDEMDEEYLRLFLHFATTEVCIPVGGLNNPGSQHYNADKITITKSYELGIVPISHTCFYQIEFSLYESKEELKEKLMMALTNHKYTAGSFDIC
jgi:hypothetical protein